MLQSIVLGAAKSFQLNLIGTSGGRLEKVEATPQRHFVVGLRSNGSSHLDEAKSNDEERFKSCRLLKVWPKSKKNCAVYCRRKQVDQNFVGGTFFG